MAATEVSAADGRTRRAPPIVRRHGATVLAMAVGVVVAIIGSWLPWIYSGSRARHSYDIFALVDRLGFSPDGLVGVSIRAWPLMPLITIAAMVLAWWGWRRSGGALGVAGGLYASGVGAAVAGAPAVVEIGIGPRVTAIGGVVLLLASVATFVVSPPGRTPPTGPARPGPP